ncbi:hypothetical protein Y032_0219g2487 [Ancylostoma ceylanicum]|uniref:Uncharacterized protein n=1 Tax=Ancylostoma ceylanicum TaxID=53326 RepID=A0A016SIQ8_9BILA|nr:hypothetical protein Y032_0219g2487 [Ancylostoma ceylanicum]
MPFELKQVGVTGGPSAPVRVAWLRSFLSHDVIILLFVVLIICSHPSLMSSLNPLRIFGGSSWIKKKIQKKVYSLDGHDLTVEPNEEQNFYFKTYAKMWEAGPKE